MIHPVQKVYITQGYGGAHTGTDFRTTQGMSNSILAVANGIIVNARYDEDGYGYYYDIKHDAGFYSRSAHLIKHTLKIGDIVKEGSEFTHTTGDPRIWGRSTGEHLHFEIFPDKASYDNRKRTNPMLFIENYNKQHNEKNMLIANITARNKKFLQDILDGNKGYFRSGSKWYMVDNGKIVKEYNSPQEMISDNMCLGLSEQDKNKLI